MKTTFRKCAPTIIALITLTTFSCTKYQIPGNQIPEAEIEPAPVSSCSSDTVYFQNTILPLVVSSCGTTGCHDQASQKDGVVLTDYASIINTGEIKPGDPNDSELFETLSEDGDDLMPPPPYDPLSSEQIRVIRQWIAQGAKNNACSDGCDTANATFSGQIWPMMESYCTGCHSASAPGGGIVLADYNLPLLQDP